MKKIIVLILVLVAWATSLFAQITHEQADTIVMKYLQGKNVKYDSLYFNINEPSVEGIKVPIFEKNIVFQNDVIIEKKYNPQVENPSREDIIGQWKITKITTRENSNANISNPYRKVSTTYYAKYNIIYNFRGDDTVVISQTVGDMLERKPYFYWYQQRIIPDGITDQFYNFVIEKERERFYANCYIYKEETDMFVNTRQQDGYLSNYWSMKFTEIK